MVVLCSGDPFAVHTQTRTYARRERGRDRERGRGGRDDVCIVLCRVDPFAKDSPLKKMSIDHFPPDVFFVLRVVQLLRGLAVAMKVNPPAR